MQAIIYPPDDRSQWALWREQLHQWRDATRILMRYDDGRYQRTAFAWMQRAFCLGLVMLADLQCCDPQGGRLRLDKMLDAGVEEFGGYDAILLWHAYPRIGLDDRNQFDFYREVPGGLDGLRALVAQCHARGVKVYVDYNPWDTGTRREPVSDAAALADLVRAIDADAIFLDTLSFAADDLHAHLEESPVALESEILLPVEQVYHHVASWAQGLAKPHPVTASPLNGEGASHDVGNPISGDSIGLLSGTPGVLRNKWFERRHMQHRIERWRSDHTEELHTAWLNGSGMVVWENVFGSYRGWSPRDRAILRAMLPIQRRYADLFVGEGWQPWVDTEQETIAASWWERDGLRLWTVCNLAEDDFAGTVLTVTEGESWRWFDLIRGEELALEWSKGRAELRLTLRSRGVGAIVAGDETHFGGDFAVFLERQRQLERRADFDPTPPRLAETLTPVERTQGYVSVPDGMVRIPARNFDLAVRFRIRECGFYEGAPDYDLQFPTLHTMGTLTRRVEVAAFAMDETPVTNAQFAVFLQQTGYRPDPPENFLKHWSDRMLPTGLDEHPVVYVALDDMRAYARWAGKRLPREEEWQHAAQGFDELTYPWGMTWVPNCCNDGAARGTTPVKAFPDGRSPFGCYDLCGNVWEMTESERSDGRSRFCILKGGSYYRAQGSDWYADGGAQPNAVSAKMLLAWHGLDRCATVGFRCVVDLEPHPSPNVERGRKTF